MLKPKPWCDGPAPPLERHDTLSALRRGTLAYAETFYRWRWGSLTDGDRERLDSSADRATYKATRPHEERARRILERVREAAAAAAEFVSEYEPGSGGLYAEELVVIDRALRDRETAITENPVERPSRATWLRDRVLDPYAPKHGRLSEHELAVLAIIGGWWPDSITAGGVSVAYVLNEERKRQRSAQKSHKKRRNTGT